MILHHSPHSTLSELIVRPILREAHRLTQPPNWESAVIGRGADPLPFPRGSVHLYFLRLTVASGCAQNKRSIFLDNFTSLVIGMHRLNALALPCPESYPRSWLAFPVRASVTLLALAGSSSKLPPGGDEGSSSFPGESESRRELPVPRAGLPF